MSVRKFYGCKSEPPFFLLLTYIYLSKHKYSKTNIVPHKTTEDEKYLRKG